MSIGNRIKEIRESLSYKQMEFAKLLETTDKVISNWEKEVNSPDLKSLIIIAKCGKKSLDWLITGEERDYQNDEITDKITNIVAGMPEDQKLEILRVVEKEKLMADLLAKQKKK